MLYLVATPIGNLSDMTARALDVLRRVSVIACEDTRRTWALLTHFGIPRPAEMISYREGNEARAGARILTVLQAGTDVALCTDGGYPGISDPGFRLIRDAVDGGIEMSVIPGASAVTVALLMSGLPTSSWTFKGFPPRKPGPLRRFFEEESDRPHTLIVYESPYRVGATLCAAAEVLGARPAAVCVELTKKHERIDRGCLLDLAARYAKMKVKGEVTLVFGGVVRKPASPVLEASSDGNGRDRP